MTEQEAPVDNSVIVGHVVEATQRLEAPGAVTYTRSRVVRAPWWVLALVVGVDTPLQLLQRLVELVVTTTT